MISPDAHWLAFRDPGDGGLMRVWDCRREQMHGLLTGAGQSAMYDPGWQGTKVATTYADIWENGRKVGVRPVSDPATEFALDGVLLASTHMNAGQFSLQVDEVPSSRRVTVIPGIRPVLWSADGRYLFTGGARITADNRDDRGNRGDKEWECYQVWEAACPVPTYRTKESIERLLFRPDGQQLAVNGTVWDVLPGKVRPVLWQTPAQAPIRKLYFGDKGVPRLTFSGKEVWAPNRGIKDIDPVLGVASLVGFSRPLGCESLGAVPAKLAVALPESWRLPMLIRIAPPGKNVLLPLPGDKGWLDHVLKDRARTDPPRVVRPGVTDSRRSFPGYSPDDIVWGPDGKRAVIKVLYLTVSQTLEVHNEPPGGAFRGTETATQICHLLLLWDLATGQQRSLVDFRSNFHLNDLAFHPHGQLLVSTGSNGAGVRLWDLNKATVVRTLSTANSDRAVWSLDGKSLLVRMEDGKAEVFDTEGRRVREWPAPKREWNALTLNKDGQWVITGGEDRMLRIRDVHSGQVLAAWPGHEAPITALTFSPDGRYLVSGARDGTIRLWDLPWIRGELSKLGLNW